MLEIVTFTGIDERTDLERVCDLAERYPIAEFGVLVGSHTGGIFPEMDVVLAFRDLVAKGVPMALHLCGIYSRCAMEPDLPIPSVQRMGDLACALSDGFSRVQINLNATAFSARNMAAHAAGIMQFADSVTSDKVILQHRGNWGGVPVIHDNVEYLFDRSGGAGIEAMNDWPPPISHSSCRFGYAGGIGPHNIRKALDFVNLHSDSRTWIDMENRVRKGGWLDLDAVESVLEVVSREGVMH